jgi:hypothetical protein
MARFALALLLPLLVAAQQQPAPEDRKFAGMSVLFYVDLPLDIPGAVLQPGTYVLRVKREPRRSFDPAQLELLDESKTNVLAELYAVQTYDAGTREDNAILTYYAGTSGRRILKSWNLAMHYREQIVYPAAQAAELGKLTSETVLTMPLPDATETVSSNPSPTAPKQAARAATSDAAPGAPAAPATLPRTAGNLPLVLWLGFTAFAAFLVFRAYRINPALAQNALNNAVARRAAATAYRTYKSAKAASEKQA